MKKLLTLAMAIMLTVSIGGCQGTVKRAQCPSEDIYVNTEAGMLQFYKGELDEQHEYIYTQKDMEELIKLYQQEIQKQKGDNL